MTKWGLTLETLRKRWDPGGTDPDRNSIGELCRRAGIERSEYFRICHKSKFGPSVSKVINLLHAMGYSWIDWAITLEGSAHIKPDTKAKLAVAKKQRGMTDQT